MIISIEQLLNIPGIRVLSVKVEEHILQCEIESTQGYSMCHRCGQKATEFHEMDIVTHYFISRSSSGWVEGLNNKIKVLKRRAYGIKNLGNLFRRIWLDLRGYEAFAH